MPFPEITHVVDAIHNPADPRHFMRLKPVSACVTIRRGEGILAQSTAAKLVLEVGRDLYDPVYYIPQADVLASLISRPEKTTICPLKGRAHAFDLSDAGGSVGVEDVAWTYAEPHGFAEALKGLVGFYNTKVSIEIEPSLNGV